MNPLARVPASGEFRRRAHRLGLLIAVAAFLSSAGCQTHPKEIEGRKVVGVRWVDGKRVYLVEDANGDRTTMTAAADEAREASEGVRFKPLK